MLQPGSELMDTSSRRRVVTVKLDASRQSLVREGDTVRVELPDGRTVSGTIAKIGKVAESPPATDEQQGDEGEPYVEMIVVLDGAVGGFDQAPVEVSIESERRRDVLAVAVAALLALVGGGYAVEVVEGRSTRLVAVETGAHADGYVEIRGRGIRAGMRVAVPR